MPSLPQILTLDQRVDRGRQLKGDTRRMELN